LAILTRKISRAKWATNDGLAKDEIPADAVTADLRTTGNTLSFWLRNDSSEVELHQAVLALAAGGERIDKIDLAWVEQAVVVDSGITLISTPGNTLAKSLVNTHRDLERLDLTRLVAVARAIAGAVDSGQWRRFRKKVVLGLLVDAVNEDIVGLTDLNPKIREDVEQAMRAAVVDEVT